MKATPKMSTTADQQQEFWTAVENKDRSYDGKFVFAVTSTGIYCRPSCAARRPKRSNVRFFATNDDAERSGFRACLRCRPSDPNSAESTTQSIQRACRLIEKSVDENVGLELLSERLGMSSFHLQRTFKEAMGVTPKQYAAACRSQRFRDKIRAGEAVTAAMYDAGYGSSSRLYERAGAELGMTPATYKRAGRDVTVRFTIADSPLGRLLVAGTDKGICAVRLGSSDAELEADLRKEYSSATFEKTEALAYAVNQIVDLLSLKLPRVELPLDIRATAFQRLVWQALQAIPFGETRSYSELAKQIGQPKAVRAVARACASNPVALVIPCHRVIREDKSLGGYRWGLERKKKLLADEKAAAEDK